MTAYTQAQHAIAQFAERFAPELKRRIVTFTAASIGIALIALLLLVLIGATYEPFTWVALVCAGAGYGWFAHSTLTTDSSIQERWVFYTGADKEEV